MSIRKKIALAIKKADRSYFFEDYDRQAKSVIQSLQKDGYVILPKEPDHEMLRKVADSIATGKMKPEEHIKNVYLTLQQLMQKNY